jgi:hypothetical protein
MEHSAALQWTRSVCVASSLCKLSDLACTIGIVFCAGCDVLPGPRQPAVGWQLRCPWQGYE